MTRQSQLFATLDQKHRIFQRRDVPASLPMSSSAGAESAAATAGQSAALAENGIEKSARRLMEKHAPAYVVVDANHDVLRFSGQTEKYLAPTPGAASLNLFSLVRRGLRAAARAALAKALASRQPVTNEALAIEVDGRRQLVDLVVEPLPDGGAGLCIVAFLDRRPPTGGYVSGEKAQPHSADALEKELRATRERLETTIDQLETSSEEMKSANEEYQSVNEELQSTNEELETSKEEMQSINEELQTVNAELNSKNDTLLHLNSDLKNLLDSTQIATLFLDRQFRVRNFTPTMTDLFHLREGDRGRPVTEIVSRFSYDGLRKDATRVMRDLSTVERTVRVDGGGPVFLMRLRPYRTVDNVIDGVVVTFVDISERERFEEDRAKLAVIVEASQDAIIGHSLEGTITSWNGGAERIFGHTAKEALGKPLSFLLGEHQSDEVPRILEWLAKGERVEHFETSRTGKRGKRIEVSMTISPIRDPSGAMIAASTIARDITEGMRHQGERGRLAAIVESTDDAIVSKDLEGVIVTWNRGAELLFGYSADEAIGKSITILIPPDYSDEEPMILERIRRGKHIEHYETVRRRKDGSKVEVSLTVSPIKNAEGAIIGASKIARDITERKRVERALAESDAQAQGVFEASPDCVEIIDLEGRVERMNANGQCTMEIDDFSAIRGAYWPSLWPQETRVQVEAAITEAMGGRTGRFSGFCPTVKGTPKWWDVMVTAVRGADGTAVRLVASSRDISERMRGEEERLAAEQALRASEQRFRAMSDNIAQLAWTCDRLGDVTWYNQRWLDYTGLPFDAMKDWGWKQVHHPDHVDRVVANVTRSRNLGEIWEDTFPLRGADGDYRWFLSRAVPILDDAGNVLRWFGTNTDITALRDAEVRQQLLVDELNHRVKNTLAAVQSIAAQSLKGASDVGLRRVFDERLIALSRTHDLLSRHSWESTSLRDLLLQEIEPYRSDESARFMIAGPDFMVKPKVALALGMAFHELATNAAKYGALSKSEGQVRVAWEVVGPSEPSALRLTWTERGGPPVKKRERKGFGSAVIERGLSLELNGEVTLDFEPSGLVCTIDIPFPVSAGGESS